MALQHGETVQLVFFHNHCDYQCDVPTKLQQKTTLLHTAAEGTSYKSAGLKPTDLDLKLGTAFTPVPGLKPPDLDQIEVGSHSHYKQTAAH